jgi:hypothetical protein
MRRQKLIEAVVVAGFVALWGGIAHADGSGANTEEFSARLSGFQELGSLPSATAFPTGAILSDGTGTLSLKLNENTGSIDFTLTYSNVGSTSPMTGMVSQAHIHFGKARDSGGILVYFCTNLSFVGHTGPTPQSCPKNSGTVTGTFKAANVQAILTQNVAAGNFDALEDALKSNTAYANIHTVPLTGATNTAFPAGEIRGQIRAAHHDEDHN